MSKKTNSSRRNFLKNTLKGTAGAAMLANIPTIVPASVLGKYAPSNRINVGAIGAGRIARDWDIPGTMKQETSRVLAVCDLDSKRLQLGKKFIDDYYAGKGQSGYNSTKTYEHYEELIADKDIDAVIIATPDHWHVLPAITAARAGKHIYMEKPASLCISEGRRLSDEVHRAGVVFQVGSQQRSMPQFKKACELVRNGRVGKLHTIYVGLPVDNPKESTPEKEMPIPSNLNFEKWLGATPYVSYTEKLVHPQNDFSRPGWLRCEQFGAGMITGWGSHHFDIANWGMGTEDTGPIELSGTADWPDEKALWDVHGNFKTETIFANGVKVLASNEYPNGVKFVGDEGWIFVTRGNYSVTASDPIKKGNNSKALDASNPKILDSVIGPNEIHLIDSKEHHANWLNAIITGEPNIAPIEAGHRACSVCLLNNITMQLKRKLYWDPVLERFKNDDEANFMLKRSERWPYQIDKGFNVKTTM
ncbi:MAG: Gfo/Idh/MocA family oxidoreductase [Terrimonas sp.]|uniref:Gfo/Idh/MocA family protein n=1 Tax=Terrimonas sp. TaxID=1914338 RepID=UPI00092868FF|nr:Gfo/Idh/MocA family oxidoreductase [Terrimonas sp.]MBN8787264.1 Gfo/Idh/MocA family oxidoreductase [Terrimonas sp.]OJY95842.1 MAG: oxidoreductase [Sphingobacteriales bacterium 40-81]PVD51259.1 oxidoreductase [Terrimonas sp.]